MNSDNENNQSKGHVGAKKRLWYYIWTSTLGILLGIIVLAAPAIYSTFTANDDSQTIESTPPKQDAVPSNKTIINSAGSTRSDKSTSSVTPRPTLIESNTVRIQSCILEPIPYKTYWERGTSWPQSGVDGYTHVCTYTDGHVQRDIIHQPDDEIIYVNVSSGDYSTAYGICTKLVRNLSQINDCMSVVWGNF